MCVGFFFCLHNVCNLVCLVSKLSLWSHRTNLTDERKRGLRAEKKC